MLELRLLKSQKVIATYTNMSEAILNAGIYKAKYNCPVIIKNNGERLSIFRNEK